MSRHMGSVQRKLVLAVSLVVIFFVSYKVASNNRETVSTFSPTALFALLPIIFAAFFGFFLWMNKGLAAKVSRASIDVNEGRPRAALLALEPLKKRKAGPVDLYLGQAFLALWRLDEAVQTLEPHAQRSSNAMIREYAEPQLWLAKALRGDSIPSTLDMSAATSRLANGVMKARNRAWNEVGPALTLEKVRALGGRDRALAEALRSWALVETGETANEVDVAGVLGEANVDAVRKYWPDFAVFLERHGT